MPSIIEQTAELLRDAEVLICRISEKLNYIDVATYWNPVPKGVEFGIEHFHFPQNRLTIDFEGNLLTLRYPVGQVSAVIRSSHEPEVVVKAVVGFYKMGEKEEEKLFPIGVALFYFQFNGLAAFIENETTIAVGVYHDPIEKPAYHQIVEAAMSKRYTITDYIHKETASWITSSLDSDEKLSFKSVEEASNYILEKRTKGNRRKGW